MTREQTIECIKVMQAYVDGKELEILSLFGKWERATAPRWNWDDTEYRIKSTSTLRPWTADEVPIGAWLREKQRLDDRRILGWTSNQSDRDIWLDEREHSTDLGKTWLPCGAVEESR